MKLPISTGFASVLGWLYLMIGGTAMAATVKTHVLKATPQTVHTGTFDAALPPVLTIESGDTVVLSTMMLMDGRLRCGMTWDELLAVRTERIERNLGAHTLTGPIFIKDAKPGDTLEVRIKRVLPAACGVNYFYPASMKVGGLPDDFPAGRIITLTLDRAKMETAFAPGVIVPLRPFLGVMGVAPRPGEPRPAWIPDYFGGNMDNKELVAGTTLFLPVNAPGALFSAGDCHAAQGDGEVCETAIETAAEEAELQFIVRRDFPLERPMAETPSHWIAMGFHEDLDRAVTIALRDAVRFIARTKSLALEEAYELASLAVDLRVTQIVDGNKGVHAMIPKAVFRER